MSALATYRGPWTKTHAAHLLNRAGFGGTRAEIERVTHAGLAKTLDALLEPAPDSDSVALPRLPEPLPPLRQLRDLPPEQRERLRREHREAVSEIRCWWIRRMLTTSQPLVEKMTLFWHGHFATAARDVKNARQIFNQNQQFRRHALGNFRQLLHAMCRDPALLCFLDNHTSRQPRPNENFARELLELFTLGVGNYTEDDVRAAARAFTGWSVEGDEFRFRHTWHDNGRKTFLGRSGNLDGSDVVDGLLEHPGTARFLVRKLFEFFVHDNPPSAVVDELARSWRAENYELQPLLRRMFSAQVFYSPAAWRTQIKSPVQLVVGTVRLLELNVPAVVLAQIMRELGQDLLEPPTVKGWDGGDAWINSNTLIRRYNLAASLLTAARGKTDDTDPDAVRSRRANASTETPDALAHLISREESVEPQAIVRSLLVRLLPAPVSNETETLLVEQARAVLSKDRARVVTHMILSMPEYQLC